MHKLGVKPKTVVTAFLFHIKLGQFFG